MIFLIILLVGICFLGLIRRIEKIEDKLRVVDVRLISLESGKDKEAKGKFDRSKHSDIRPTMKREG